MKGQGMLISAFVFALVIAIFAVINVEQVEVNFLFAKTATPLILVILVSTLLGGLTVGLFGMLRIFKLQRTVKSLEKKVVEMTEAAEPFEAAFGSSSARKTQAEPQDAADNAAAGYQNLRND
ncbi:lipopolysaccharide assembly protein LapA domain-containing protein [Paenibacillus sp. LHD-117]|uniref:LapA family protein n=1 Tax=Paenibacillus sp. LHD-117 TaxID=3071412 RepID=UPI0027E088B5|nr:lipopolysaccharide assembly protein LapA domain-containing protein [Paenibacillus sp. LHD-117]MDQ6420066.1 lipopolysaccharide assembly protein LapA domain-containing protein [Paenibacillus sp. LHD-117]